MTLDTLIVNTYAGSLLLGADAVNGHTIRGSYEDVGFGSPITKANRARFRSLAPHFRFVDHHRDWPDQDLTSTVVLAHPPCAAFSQQNTSAAKRGVNTDAFSCTVKVAKYAMSNGAAALAIESVPGALGGAWDVHDHLAEAGGYHLYRVMKNSILFGVPQFRERFWAVFVRRDLADPVMTWRLAPQFRTVGAVLDPLMPGAPFPELDKAIDKFVRKLVAEHGFDEAEVRRVGLETIGGSRRRGFAALLQPRFFPTEDARVVCRKYVSPFTSGQPSVLAPYGFTPVLLGSSLWVYQGKPVPPEGYKAIMGFPTDYVFPPCKGHGMRTFLSKGVCPPVASWILDNVRRHLGAPQGSVWTGEHAYKKTCEPGRIVSFRPSAKAIKERYEQLDRLSVFEDDEPIPLRNEEAELES